MEGTSVLLASLENLPHQRVLEIGFGTGQTLVEVAVRWPDLELFGLEKSPLMFDAARQRLQFCRLEKIQLTLITGDGSIPFPDDFFDVVYAESVLAIQPDEQIEGYFREIFRVLRPGGAWLNNESLWLEHISAGTSREINTLCRDLFGIQQAPEKWRQPTDWQKLAQQTGFQVGPMIRMHGLQIPLSRHWKIPLLRSAIFSLRGKIRSLLSANARAQNRTFKRAMKQFSDFGPFLEGVFFQYKKPLV